MPQASDEYQASDDDALRNEFETLMPYSEDPWDHTIAFTPQFSDMYVMYLFPSYLGMQCCENDYLVESIEDNTLKSKYIWTERGNSVDAACRNMGLTKLWTNGDWNIYTIR